MTLFTTQISISHDQNTRWNSNNKKESSMNEGALAKLEHNIITIINYQRDEVLKMKNTTIKR